MKVLLTATVQSHICQFHKPLVEVLHKHGCEVHVAAKDNLAEKNGLKLDFVEKIYNVPFSRSPKSTDNLEAYKKLKKIIAGGNYDVIHCNTPMGGIVTRLAARNARKNGAKVFYTAHGFHFYQGAPILNWLVYFPIEFIFGKLFTDKLITISDEDYEMAKKHRMCREIEHIHSVGINSQKYHVYCRDEILEEKAELRLAENIVCLCTGELNDNKRQRLIIDAMPKIVRNIPNAMLLLAGNGPNEEKLRIHINELGMERYISLLGYRTDLQRFVSIADVVASASLREGLGINLIEAMACQKPIVGSINRGHCEFLKDGMNGYLIPEEDFSNIFADRIIHLFQNAELRDNMGIYAAKVSDKYMDYSVRKELEQIYWSRTCS